MSNYTCKYCYKATKKQPCPYCNKSYGINIERSDKEERIITYVLLGIGILVGIGLTYILHIAEVFK